MSDLDQPGGSQLKMSDLDQPGGSFRMCEVEQPEVSLLALEDDLSCSICLSPFDYPVTLPCGHNFCQDCLLATWKDSYSCPQCRTVFPTKPELKKNTVLSSVVESFMMRAARTQKPSVASQESRRKKEEEERRKKETIRCDACMEAEASHTCLTCMASYCQEHLRPHRDNPVFRLHQLMEPIGDLMERICPDHHKLMELFCSQHGRPICSLCLQQAHKGCSFTSPEERRGLLESDFNKKLSLLNQKLQKTDDVLSQINDLHSKLKDEAGDKKAALAAVYRQIRDAVSQDEREAQREVDGELENGQTKLRDLAKKLSDNREKLGRARESLNSLLERAQTQSFLKASFDLPKVVKFEPSVPRVNLDSKKVAAAETFAAALKESLTETFKQPVEARIQTKKADPPKEQETKSQTAANPPSQPPPPPPSISTPPPPPPSFTLPHPHPLPPRPPLFQGSVPPWDPRHFSQATGFHPGWQWAPPPPRLPRSHSQGPPPRADHKKKPQKQTKKAAQSAEDKKKDEDSKTRGRSNARAPPAAAEGGKKPETPLDVTSAEKRNELLKYGTVITLDPRTAHKRIVLSEGFTTASVSDEHRNYPECPERFAVCSQVLSTKGFSQDRHYWEVRIASPSFVGVGLAYGSIERQGPASRLGRNAQSWSVEWFNGKLSAWHNSSEMVLVNPNPKRVGVLLDCDEGSATFYTVADRAYPFHTFLFPFDQAVYPAFWIFSSASSISLCKLNA